MKIMRNSHFTRFKRDLPLIIIQKIKKTLKEKSLNLFRTHKLIKKYCETLIYKFFFEIITNPRNIIVNNFLVIELFHDLIA